MKKYYWIGVSVTFFVIFNLGYVFHEIIAGDFFKQHIGAIQRDAYIIPYIAICFLLYTLFQAYFLPIYYNFTSVKYGWSLTKTALIFGSIIGLFWDGLQGGLIEVATFKMPLIVFFYDSSYHAFEGILTALLLSLFYKRFAVN
jgi:hypothetical protein